MVSYFKAVPEIGPLLAGQAARHGVPRLHVDPAAVQPGHRAQHLLPRPRPRHAGRRAARLGPPLPRQAGRDDHPLELDGDPAGGAAARGLRRGVGRRHPLPAGGARRPDPALRDPGGDRVGDHAGAGQRVPGPPHPRPARPGHDPGRGRPGAAAAAAAPRAAGGPRGIPVAGRLHRGAPHPEQPAAAQRVGVVDGDELAHPDGRPAADRTALEHRRRVRGDRRRLPASALCQWVRASPGGRRVDHSRQFVVAHRAAADARRPGDAPRVHPQGPPDLLPRLAPSGAS